MSAMAIQPLLTADLSGVFALSQDDFTQIQLRVKACNAGKAAMATISASLPAFKNAVVVAEEWKNTLLPKLTQLAKELVGFTEQTITTVTQLHTRIDVLPPHTENLPAELREEVKTFIYTLHDNTKILCTRFDKLNDGLVRFVEANTALDFQIASKKLGFMMQTITDNLNRLEAANGRVRGRWQNLSNQLKDYGSLEGEIDMAFMMGLQLEAALSGWEKLRGDAVRFLTNN